MMDARIAPDFAEAPVFVETVALQSKPRVSAVIVTYYPGQRFHECLNTLRSDRDIHEIIVVNNGMSDLERRWIDQFSIVEPDRFRLIEAGDNLGFAKAVNLGAKHAAGDRILVLNPDAVLKRGSVTELERARSGRASPCLVGGKLFYANGLEQRGARRELLTLPRALMTYLGLSKLESVLPMKAFRSLHREKDPEPTEAIKMDVVSGALLYMSTEDFWKVGGFDEGYFLHVEDIDLCRRVGEEGGDVVYTPKASALHYGSTSNVSRAFVEWHKAKGLARYFDKFTKSRIEKVAVTLSMPLIAAALVGRVYAIKTAQQVKAVFS